LIPSVDNNVKFDHRLAVPIDFVCKNMNVTREDFASLALANLLDLELNEIEFNDPNITNSEEIKTHKETVKVVKFEANEWVENIR
jgi:hypothetical protein